VCLYCLKVCLFSLLVSQSLPSVNKNDLVYICSLVSYTFLGIFYVENMHLMHCMNTHSRTSHGHHHINYIQKVTGRQTLELANLSKRGISCIKSDDPPSTWLQWERMMLILCQCHHLAVKSANQQSPDWNERERCSHSVTAIWRLMLILFLQSSALLPHTYHIWSERCAVQYANKCKIVWMRVVQQVFPNAINCC